MKKEIHIQFTAGSHVPKYRQIIDNISQMVRDGELSKGDKIPSLNELCKKHKLSQDTVLMAYNELKSKGIITSSIGKGYFITNAQLDANHKVFLLFDKLTAYKETLYESFKTTFKGKGNEQIFFHHNNPKVFQTLIESAVGEYTEFVIMPLVDKGASEVLETLPKNKVFILDTGRSTYHARYPYVCQDFERDIYRILRQNENRVKNYSRFILVIWNQKAHLKEIANGFRDFCKQLPIEYEMVDQITSIQVRSGDAYIVVDDRDLVHLVKQAEVNKLQLGKQVGIISYNEIPLKEIIAGGITTISTDFAQMGQNMAEMILSGKKEKTDNPFVMIHRNSF